MVPSKKSKERSGSAASCSFLRLCLRLLLPHHMLLRKVCHSHSHSHSHHRHFVIVLFLIPVNDMTQHDVCGGDRVAKDVGYGLFIPPLCNGPLLSFFTTIVVVSRRIEYSIVSQLN
mmetsp:Transcript_39411/g.42698  ORF Transcript_39411/g.42698 Transcript_39411/m.42698 type:complete len:116 (-) Transcript_39411:272-619(-)